jgi:GntR family transcriptional regulator, transcriptional repressor for pyruvate dehydrogenase complex
MLTAVQHLSGPEDSRDPREDVTVHLLRHFKQLMRTGELVPGCQLPPERELSQQFGVGRASLRQALKVLQVMGVVNQRVGDGTYLANDARDCFREPLDFLMLLAGISHDELFELRLLVEPELAALAARRASPQQRADMAAAVEGMAASRTTAQRITADLQFHDAVFRAAGNRACLFLFSVIQRAVLKTMEDSAPALSIENLVRLHAAIYRAIEKRNASAARRAMTRHLHISRKLALPLAASAGNGKEQRS